MRMLFPTTVSLLCANMLAGCALAGGGSERVDMFLTDIPRFAREYEIRQGWKTLIVFQGTSLDEWSEASETFELRKERFPPTARAVFDDAISPIPEFAGLTFKLLEEDESSVMFEGIAVGRHVVGKIMQGDVRLWIVCFTARGIELSEDKRDSWLRLLSAAQVVQ